MSDEKKNAGLGGMLGGMAKGLGEGALGAASSTGGAAKGLSGDALGQMASLLGGATGAGGQLGGMLGGLLSSGAGKVEELPVVGPIVTSVAEKLGIPASQATALVSGALTMLMSKMKSSDASSVDELDLDDWDAAFADESDVVAKVAEETGLDEQQVTEGMQEAVKMLANASND